MKNIKHDNQHSSKDLSRIFNALIFGSCLFWISGCNAIEKANVNSLSTTMPSTMITTNKTSINSSSATADKTSTDNPSFAAPVNGNGYSRQGNKEIIILEDIPDLGRIKLDDILGTDEDGNKFFLQRYTTFQRRIRDLLLKRMEEYGFLVNLLEDKELYSRYKTKNGTLVGVYFDPQTNKFQVNKQLLNMIKTNNPNTLVICYRIDSIVYVPESKRFSISINLSIKDLNAGTTHVVGTYKHTGVIDSRNKEVIIDELASEVELSFDLLMKQENAAIKINDIITHVNKPSKKEPISLNINAVRYDAQNRKKLFYRLRTQLIEKGLSTADKIHVSDSNMSVVIVSDVCNNVEELYFEYLIPFFASEKISLHDDRVHYDNQTMLIKLDDNPPDNEQPENTRTKKNALRIAVLYFDNNTGSEKYAPLSKALCDLMINDLVQIPDFEIIERSRIEEVIKELRMNEGGLIDPSRSSEIGKLLGAEYLVFGSYIEIFGKFRIDTRIVKVETGKICVACGQNGNAAEFDEIEHKIVKQLTNGLLPQKANRAEVSQKSQKHLSVNSLVQYGTVLDMLDRGNTYDAKAQLQVILSETPYFVDANKVLQTITQQELNQ